MDESAVAAGLILLWSRYVSVHRVFARRNLPTALKYSTAVNHYTALNLTKLDILDTFPTIKVAIGYKDPVINERLESFPASLDVLERVEVEYKEFKGWQEVRLPSRIHYTDPSAKDPTAHYREEELRRAA